MHPILIEIGSYRVPAYGSALLVAFAVGVHVAELVAEDLGSDQVGLTLTLPVDVSLSFVASGIETTLSLGGDVVMTGTTAIPEPRTGLLLAFALICLSAARRAHRRS